MRTPRHQRWGTDREILRLAVPAFGALVAEPLFLLADSAVVGRLGTAPPRCARRSRRSPCERDRHLRPPWPMARPRPSPAGSGRDLRSAVADGADGVRLAALLGVVVAGLGAAFAEPLVAAFGASGQAVTHLRWSLPGLPAMLVVLAATGASRGGRRCG